MSCNCNDSDGGCYQGDTDSNVQGMQYNSLYEYIIIDSVRGLNENEPESSKTIIKPNHCRHDRSKFVESEGDDQLIIHIPFTCSVKITSITLSCGPYQEAPNTMKAFINRPEVDFSNTNYNCIQEWSIAMENGDGRVASYPTRLSKFSNVNHLTLYFPSSYGGKALRIFYIGIHGLVAHPRQDRPVIAVYESRANLSDHPTTYSRPVHFDTAQ